MSQDAFPIADSVIEAWRRETPTLRRFLTDSIRAEVGARGVPRVALGVSGGLDSAVAAQLCVEAIGAENVLALLLPVRTTDPSSLSIAQGVVNALGITTRRVNLSAVADAYFANFPDAPRQRRGACLGWLRTGVLLDLASTYGATVVQTINRTDRELGYGDAAHELTGALRPLAQQYKTQVALLAEEMQVLPEVRRRRPSLEQWPGQTDEADLGCTYDVLDPLLVTLERGTAPDEAERQGYPAAATRMASERRAAVARRIPASVSAEPGEPASPFAA